MSHTGWCSLAGFSGCLVIQGRDCTIWIEPRPTYCDRGNYIAKVDARGDLARGMDGADAWPRYYFDLDRAKLEIEAWLRKREQWIDAEIEVCLGCGKPTADRDCGCPAGTGVTRGK